MSDPTKTDTAGTDAGRTDAAADADANPLDPRDRVFCDDNCGAFNEPRSPEEVLAALEHWREHTSMGGCAHGY